MTPTPIQKRAMRAALGLPNSKRTSYRNYYLTPVAVNDNDLFSERVA